MHRGRLRCSAVIAALAFLSAGSVPCVREAGNQSRRSAVPTAAPVSTASAAQAESGRPEADPVHTGHSEHEMHAAEPSAVSTPARERAHAHHRESDVQDDALAELRPPCPCGCAGGSGTPARGSGKLPVYLLSAQPCCDPIATGLPIPRLTPAAIDAPLAGIDPIPI